MAHRFPSIEDIDSGTNDGTLGLIHDSADTSDFLARERAVLGDDADQFSTTHDNIPKVAIDDDEDDLLGGSGDQAKDALDGVMQFHNSFPAVDTRNERVAPGGTITGSASSYLPGVSSSSRPLSPSGQPIFQTSEEPDVVREWRERRSLAIQHREEAAAERKSSTIKAAQEAIDEFYDNYNNKKEKSIAQTKREAESFLEKREDTSAGGTSWERIAKLVDVRGTKGQAGAAGKERFRGLLVDLTKDESAPGAKGY